MSNVKFAVFSRYPDGREVRKRLQKIVGEEIEKTITVRIELKEDA